MEQKRDMDLIRLLLFDREGVKETDLTQYTKEQIRYHKYLLIQAGLATGDAPVNRERGVTKISSAVLYLITWEGQEFLNNARNETVWKKATKIVTEKAGTVSFTILKAVLQKLAMDAVDHAPPFAFSPQDKVLPPPLIPPNSPRRTSP